MATKNTNRPALPTTNTLPADTIVLEMGDWTPGNAAPMNPAVTLPSPPPPAPPAPPTKRPSRDSKDGGWDLGVSDASASLVEEERKVATRLGFKHDDGKLLFTAGTQLADVGMEQSARYAREYAAMPTISDVAIQHAATITAEDRSDKPILPSLWRLNTQGKLYHTLKPESCVSLSDTAWSQLGARQADIKSAPAGSSLDLKAARVSAIEAPRGNMNAWLHAVEGESKARVRTLRGQRQIFAVVSSGKRGYTAYDSDRIMADLARAMPDTKCEMSYDADTTRIKVRALYQAPVDIGAFVGVGRIHRVGIQFSSRDDGMASLEGTAFIERIACKNHTLTNENTGRIRRKHTGTYDQLCAQIAALVGRLPELINGLKDVWARAATEYYLDSETGESLEAPEAIARLVAHGHLTTGGLDESEAIEAYVRAWRAEESPHSAAGIYMAVQRAAHETSWKTRWTDDVAEEQASALLHQHVFALRAPELAAE